MRRFLALLLPAFLIVSAAGLYGTQKLALGDERNSLVTRVGNIAARTASAINKLPKGSTQTNQESILALLLSDPAVDCAVLIDDKGNYTAAAPARVGCKGVAKAETLEIPLSKTLRGTLCVKYNLTELEARSTFFSALNFVALLIGLLAATGASWFSFRNIVGKPVSALLNAIQQTQVVGRPMRVENMPDDELGTVISAFNNMQLRIEDQTTRNAEALRRLDYVYNETPALMFSMDHQGQIQTASGHWLETTGYTREDMIGEPLATFLSPSTPIPVSDIQNQIVNCTAPLRDLPFILRCKDGRTLDVLMAVVPDVDSQQTANLCVLSDISGLKAAQNKLRSQAITDHLTGLPNRQGLFEILAEMRNACAKSKAQSALLFVDLDNFKTVNDTMGHDAGDKLLQAASKRLQNCIASKDYLARLGGDEFAIVLNGLRDSEDATVVAKRIVAAFTNPFRIDHQIASVGTSIGIALFSDCENSDDILRLADLAMYKSKQSGKNCVSNYSNDLTAKVIGRDLMIRRIRDALAFNHFTFYLQPIVDLQAMKAVGAEALLRLACPNDGLMAPTEIIKTAEECGLIDQITAWTLAEAYNVASNNRQIFSDANRYIAVNLSPKNVTAQALQEVLERLRGNPVVAKSLVFEITETALFSNSEEINKAMQAIRETGARIALDDFGTGFSSLGHLHRFPVDMIKIDRSFVKGLTEDNEDAKRRRALIKATATMAVDLNMKIVAEGIEDLASAEYLRDIGISYGQGYLFSAAQPVSVMAPWLQNFGASHVARNAKVLSLNSAKRGAQN